MTAFSF